MARRLAKHAGRGMRRLAGPATGNKETLVANATITSLLMVVSGLGSESEIFDKRSAAKTKTMGHNNQTAPYPTHPGIICYHG